MKNKKEALDNMIFKIVLAFLFVGGFISVMWSLSVNNTPVYDDFILLNQARFTEYKDLFHLLPTSTYNDRPLRMLLLKLLNDYAGNNYQTYHIVLVLIHLLNIYLAYKVTQLLIKDGTERTKYFAIIAGAIFGIYPFTQMPVVWIANTPDLQCCTFILLTLLFYLKRKNEERTKTWVWIWSISTIISFYLSLRCKEMALSIPIILFIYEINLALNEHKRLKLNTALCGCSAIMAVFIILLFADKSATMVDSPIYYQSFNLRDLLLNALKYLFLYFDWNNSAFYFDKFSSTASIGVASFVIMGIYAIYLAIKKKNWGLICSIISIGVSLLVVLPLVNSVHRTYLYIPGFFVGLSYALCLYKVLENINWSSIKVAIMSTGLIVLMLLLSYTNGHKILKDYWIKACEQENKEIEQIQKIKKPEDNSNIYVKGASEGYNAFYYGPGESLKYIFYNNTYHTELVDEYPDNPIVPYIFLEYNEGVIKEIERN